MKKYILGLLVILTGLWLFPWQAKAVEADNYCFAGQVTPPFQPCTSANPLPVTVSGVAQVGGSEFSVSTTPTVTNASYVAGKCMGGLQTVAVARATGIGGILNKIVYTSKAGSTSAITFYVFKSSPTTSCADTATFTLNSADLSLLVGVWAISPAVIPNQTQSYAELANLGASFVPSGNSNVYVYVVSNATQTPSTTSDIVFNLIGLQD